MENKARIIRTSLRLLGAFALAFCAGCTQCNYDNLNRGLGPQRISTLTSGGSLSCQPIDIDFSPVAHTIYGVVNSQELFVGK